MDASFDIRPFNLEDFKFSHQQTREQQKRQHMRNLKGVKVSEQQLVNLSPKTYNEPSSCGPCEAEIECRSPNISSPAEVVRTMRKSQEEKIWKKDKGIEVLSVMRK